MRFTYEDKTDLTPREAAQASGVAEMYIVAAYSTAKRFDRTGFNAGGKYFGIVGAEPPEEKPAKPMLELAPAEGIAQHPGSTYSPKKPAPPRRPADRDEEFAAVDDAIVIPAPKKSNKPTPPVEAAQPEPADRQAQPDEENAMGQVPTRWESPSFPGKTFTADELSQKLDTHVSNVRMKLNAGEELKGHKFTKAEPSTNGSAHVDDKPPRAPKTRRARLQLPAPVATQPPASTALAIPANAFQAQRERYQREYELEVAAATARLKTRLAVLDDLEQPAANGQGTDHG